MSEPTSPDFDFRHHLYDTVILLGGKQEIADLLKKSMDGGITAKDVDALRNYNCDLVGLTKDKLCNVNKMQIQVKGSGER